MELIELQDLERYHELRNTMTPEEALDAMLEEKIYREASEEELEIRRTSFKFVEDEYEIF